MGHSLLVDWVDHLLGVELVLLELLYGLEQIGGVCGIEVVCIFDEFDLFDLFEQVGFLLRLEVVSLRVLIVYRHVFLRKVIFYLVHLLLLLLVILYFVTIIILFLFKLFM